MAPLVKVGGLGDVVGALAAEQARQGHRVTVALPGYPGVTLPPGWSRRALSGCEVPWGMGVEPASFEVLHSGEHELRVLLVHHLGERRFFERPGIYDDPVTGEGYADNAERFLFFARAAVEGLKRFQERFDILHAHDHQSAWAPCFVRTHDAYELAFDEIATVFTIHNLGYQGIHDPWVLALAGFGAELFYPASPFEFWGRVNYMKVGLEFSDLLTTVSPRYAREIQTSGEYGWGLEGVLARRRQDLVGILNGIDDAYWNPETDPYLPQRYNEKSLATKARVTEALCRRCGLPDDGRLPVVGMVSRLAEQKGFDLIEQARAELLRLDARFVVLGSGHPRYQELLRSLAASHPDRFAYQSGYDEPLAHLIEGGADLYLMPSRYEPCGLNQMYSMRYGTPPVVRATGGLADTVQEFDPLTGEGVGFLFQRFEAGEMIAALRRALSIRKQPELWQRIQRNGMAKDFSWRVSVQAYDRVYTEARNRVAAGRGRTLDRVRKAT